MPDTAAAIEELEREPAAAHLRPRARDRRKRDEERALYRTILLPLLGAVADACGGFDWDDGVFNRVYAEIEHSLLGERHEYGAAAPLVGLSAPLPVDLGRDIVVRMSAVGELAAYWPEARGLLPSGFGDEPERMCVLELTCGVPGLPGRGARRTGRVRRRRDRPAARDGRSRRRGTDPLRADGLAAVRHPSRCCRSRRPSRAESRAASTSSVDAWRATCWSGCPACDADPELGEAVDRWELSLFADEPFRSELLRESLAALLGGADGLWAAAARAAVLVGDSGPDRGKLFASLRGVTAGGRADDGVSDVVRRALVEVLMHGDRPGLLERLDESLLGLSPRPVSYFAVRAAV